MFLTISGIYRTMDTLYTSGCGTYGSKYGLRNRTWYFPKK